MDSKSNVKENIELQLSELEMLNSMFPNEGEVEMTDPGTISDLHDFLSGKLDCLNLPKLEYVINLNTEGVIQQVIEQLIYHHNSSNLILGESCNQCLTNRSLSLRTSPSLCTQWTAWKIQSLQNKQCITGVSRQS